MIKRLTDALGRRLAHYLNHPNRRYEPFAISEPGRLAAVLQPADVLLVDGNSRVSTAIKYLTQSTWSHAVMYVGDVQNSGQDGDSEPLLIEADLEQREMTDTQSGYSRREIHHIRHYSLFAPRDFDISPYFHIIKPTLEEGFDHRLLTWADQLDAGKGNDIES